MSSAPVSSPSAQMHGLESLYREIILEEYKHPRNVGDLPDATHCASVRNPTCGDETAFALRIEDGVVRAVRFRGTGCAISQAAASLFSEHLKGKTVAEISAMDERAIVELLGFAPNPMRMKCAVLPLRATAKALGFGERE